jgi:hypothetical protein
MEPSRAQARDALRTSLLTGTGCNLHRVFKSTVPGCQQIYREAGVSNPGASALYLYGGDSRGRALGKFCVLCTPAVICRRPQRCRTPSAMLNQSAVLRKCCACKSIASQHDTIVRKACRCEDWRSGHLLRHSVPATAAEYMRLRAAKSAGT